MKGEISYLRTYSDVLVITSSQFPSRASSNDAMVFLFDPIYAVP
jgi:hypothetical protein